MTQADNTVLATQKVNKAINDLIAIQRDIILATR